MVDLNQYAGTIGAALTDLLADRRSALTPNQQADIERAAKLLSHGDISSETQYGVQVENDGDVTVDVAEDRDAAERAQADLQRDFPHPEEITLVHRGVGPWRPTT